MGWDDDPVVDVPKKTKAPPSAFESAAAGSIDGASLGFADELAGLFAKYSMGEGVKLGKGADFSPDDTPEVREAKANALRAQSETPTTYEMTRDTFRKGAKDAREANPKSYLGGQLTGALAVPVPGPSQGATLLARLGRSTATGAGMGTVMGIGTSEADSPMGVLEDAAVSGMFGAGGGLVAGGLGEGVRLVNDRATRGMVKARRDQIALDEGKAAKAFRRKQGAERSKVADAARDLEVMAREAAELPAGHPDKIAAQKYLQSPEALRLREMVLQGKLKTAPERISEHAALGAEREAASAAMTPEAIGSAVNQSLATPIATHVLPRAKTYLNRSIGPAVGGVVGGAPGAALGTLVSNSVGRPGTAMANMQKAPAVRNALWSLLEKATTEQPAGALVNPLSAPLRVAGERGLQMSVPASRLRAMAEAIKDHPEDEVLAGY